MPVRNTPPGTAFLVGDGLKYRAPCPRIHTRKRWNPTDRLSGEKERNRPWFARHENEKEAAIGTGSTRAMDPKREKFIEEGRRGGERGLSRDNFPSLPTLLLLRLGKISTCLSLFLFVSLPPWLKGRENCVSTNMFRRTFFLYFHQELPKSIESDRYNVNDIVIHNDMRMST